MMNDYYIRSMTIEDYQKVHDLWMSIHGFAIRSLGDSEEAVHRFLLRNPGISVVAECGDKIIGSILCGHDGRTACFYHVCVDENYRRRGIGSEMVRHCVNSIRSEQISKISLFAYMDNSLGNDFWKKLGFKKREDMNNYEWQLNAADVTSFNK